jgi:hypothetical protein
MDIKFIKALCFVSIIAFATIQSTCKKGNPCTEVKQSFEIGVKAIPNYDSVKINDTLWTVIDEPVNLLDITSNSVVDFSGAVNLGTNIGFQKATFSPSLNFIPSVSKFNFILVDGVETNNPDPTLFREYLFSEIGNRYKFKLGVVPKDTGIFRFVFGNASNVYRRTNGCTNAFFEINFKETSQHRYLIPGFGGNTNKGGDYYFKVK